MSHNAIANYMFAKDHNNVASNADSLTSSLNSALSKYNESKNRRLSESDETENLKDMLENIKRINSLQEARLLEGKSVLSSLVNSITTFNIYPSASYDKYTSVLGWKSDEEAINSDWVSVGNDLKLSWAISLLQKMKEQNAEE